MTTQKMHANEINISKELVRRLLEQQFPQWAEFPIEPVNSSGSDNVIYRLGADLAIRLPRIASAAPAIEKEYEWLPRLAPQLSLAIPVPIAKGKPSQSYPWPWLIYRWIDGQNATQASFDLEQVAVAFGHFVLDLRKVDITKAPRARRGSRLLCDLNNEVKTALAALHDMIDVMAAAQLWKKVTAVPTWNHDPVWIHADLHAANILVNNSEITAVIDWGMAGVGDPACDMMLAWTVLSTETRAIFRSLVNVDDATWERGKGWALSFGLIALPYYKNSNPVLASIAMNAINQVLIDS